MTKKEITPEKKKAVYIACAAIGVITAIAVIAIVIVSIITPSNETQEPAPSISTEAPVVETATFEEIYRAYKENELVANEKYQYNRYSVTAEINGMDTNGLLNMTGGATLTMTQKIDNTVVVFYAEFEKEQEEALKTVKVGDTITFEGKCLGAGNWSECELVQE